MVRAAGGIVWRRGPGGALEVLLVHRPKYDDWSFPKGKADPGESSEETARREVEEETSIRVPLGARVGTTRYLVGRFRPKTVRYYAFDANGAEAAAQNEVDELRWASAAEAERLLSHRRDRALLRRALRRLG